MALTPYDRQSLAQIVGELFKEEPRKMGLLSGSGVDRCIDDILKTARELRQAYPDNPEVALLLKHAERLDANRAEAGQIISAVLGLN